MRMLAASVTCCLALTLAGAAAARQTIAPPGNSGVDQYFETVPGAGGNVAVHRSTGAPVRGSAGPNASSGGAGALARFGADGQAAAALAAATAPIPPGRSPGTAGAGANRAKGGSTGKGAAGGPAVPGAYPAAPVASGSTSALLGVLGGSDQGGLGLILPILLLGALVAAVTLGAVRRRRRDPKS